MSTRPCSGHPVRREPVSASPKHRRKTSASGEGLLEATPPPLHKVYNQREEEVKKQHGVKHHKIYTGQVINTRRK